MKRVTIDFETTSHLDLKEVGAARYAEDATTSVLCLNLKYEGKPYRWHPGRPTAGLHKLATDPEVIFDAHQAAFEKHIWRQCMVKDFGLPDIPNERWDCTMATANYRGLPGALDKLARVLRLQAKDKEGSGITVGLSRYNKKGYLPEITPEILARVLEYCDSDVEIEEQARHRLGVLPPEERENLLQTERMNERGVKVDMAFARAAMTIVDQMRGPLEAEHRALTKTWEFPDGLKQTQRDKVLLWLEGRGHRLPDLQRTTVEEALGISTDDDGQPLRREVDLPEDVFRVLEIRYLLNATSISKLEKMIACPNLDGRVRNLFRHHGTGPGRTTSELLQLQNFPRGTLKDPETKKAFDPDKIVAAIMTGSAEYVQKHIGPPIEAISSSLRHALIADDGMVLMAGDYSGIQARVCLALAGQYDKVDLMAAGKDIYCDMASSIYRREILKDRDPEERQTGKNAVLGLGFGMGHSKFFDKYGEGQSLEFIEEVVRVYRKEWAPRVPALWYGLSDAAVACVHKRERQQAFLYHNRQKHYLPVFYDLEDGWLSCQLPSGRKIWYWNPQPTFEPAPWDPDEIRQSFTYEAYKQGQMKEVRAFGGLLTENVVMGIERDIMTIGKHALEREGFFPVMDVHDEVVCEVPEDDFDAGQFEACMLEANQVEWVRQLRIPVAVEVWKKPVKRYRK